MKLAGGLLGMAAIALVLGVAAPAAEARARGWSRACACEPAAKARRVVHRRARRHYSSYRPVLAVDSVPIVVETRDGPIAVGQRRTISYVWPHPHYSYDYPWDGYGGPYYGYPAPRGTWDYRGY